MSKMGVARSWDKDKLVRKYYEQSDTIRELRRENDRLMRESKSTDGDVRFNMPLRVDNENKIKG